MSDARQAIAAARAAGATGASSLDFYAAEAAIARAEAHLEAQQFQQARLQALIAKRHAAAALAGANANNGGTAQHPEAPATLPH